MVVKRCITVTEKQDEKIRAIQVKRTIKEKKTVSYSKVIQSAIDEGLRRI